MTPLETVLCLVCPFLLFGWSCAYASGRIWRSLANFWREQAMNGNRRRSDHSVPRECLRRASSRHNHRFN